MYKKVLLRERKRHTARHIASTCYAVLVGIPPPPSWDLTWMGGVPPSQVQAGGTPYQVQVGALPRSRWGGGTPFAGLDAGGTPSQVQVRGVPLPRSGQGVPPSQVQGVPLPRAGWGVPHPADRGYPTWTWEGGTPHLDLRRGYTPLGSMGYPTPRKCGWTDTCENIPSECGR